MLVGAAALGQAWFGLLLVVAYGVGLALTLTAAGFAVGQAGHGAARLLDRSRALDRLAGGRAGPRDRRWVGVASSSPWGGLVLKGAASATRLSYFWGEIARMRTGNGAAP